MKGALEHAGDATPSGPAVGWMRPFAEFSAEARRSVDFVLTDIDDTLTTEGRLTAAAYDAMERLSDAGIVVIPVTGRPAGWCDMIARFWPVGGVVGENGAFYFSCDPSGMTRVYAKSMEERQADRGALERIEHQVLAAVPRARISADQPFREADLAIDFAEDGPLLSSEEIASIVACFEDAGATAKVSSIHVNGWFGDYDKLTMARRMLLERFDVDADRENGKMLFMGDSPNDEPMFGYFNNSVAVANFSNFRDSVSKLPRWLTAAGHGEGFVEVADALIEARKSASAQQAGRTDR
jgi:HAD superfamily hydrolase (TIGR01484 family)